MLRAVLGDSLMGNPTVLTKFYLDPQFDSIFVGLSLFPFESPHAKFLLRLFVPTNYYISTEPTLNNNHKAITITRLSVGFIIGSVLSWVSILSLACGVVVGPLMEKSCRLRAMEALFIIKPALRGPNVVKFAIAEWKRGIFAKEDFYVSITERLEELKNVGTALKYQKIVRNVTTRLPSFI
jgi:hypothetical protein